MQKSENIGESFWSGLEPGRKNQWKAWGNFCNNEGSPWDFPALSMHKTLHFTAGDGVDPGLGNQDPLQQDQKLTEGSLAFEGRRWKTYSKKQQWKLILSQSQVFMKHGVGVGGTLRFYILNCLKFLHWACIDFTWKIITSKIGLCQITRERDVLHMATVKVSKNISSINTEPNTLTYN